MLDHRLRRWANINPTLGRDGFDMQYPVNTKRSSNVGTMLGQRRRQWANIVPTLAERFVFAGKALVAVKLTFYELICRPGTPVEHVGHSHYA